MKQLSTPMLSHSNPGIENAPIMKIMVLGVRGFPVVQGGVEKHAEYLYPQLVKYGCRVEVITRSPYVPRNQKPWKGIIFHRLWAPRIVGFEAFIHSLLGVLYSAIKRPNILHIHAIGPAIVTPIARLFRLNVVVTHHGPDYDREKWNHFARWVLRLGEKWGMKYANQRIVISQVISDLIAKKYNIHTVVLPNGVTLPQIPDTRSALDEFGLNKGRYVLLVSRFVPEKRHLDLIYAFNKANITGWKLVLVGKADHPDNYSRQVIEVATKLPNIVITGLQSGISLAEIYANAGIFVLPSSHEGLPIVLLEALSYGLFVLASDIPANREIKLPEEVYFPLADIDHLACRIRQIAVVGNGQDNREKRRKWVCDHYNWDDIALRTLDVYKKVYNPIF